MRAQINVTPFVDVLLVLLILFMVITPLAHRGMDVSLPPPCDGPTPRPVPGPLVLTVRPDRLELNDRVFTGLEDLATGLRDVLAVRIDRTLFVRAEGVSYGDVVSA